MVLFVLYTEMFPCNPCRLFRLRNLFPCHPLPQKRRQVRLGRLAGLKLHDGRAAGGLRGPDLPRAHPRLAAGRRQRKLEARPVRLLLRNGQARSPAGALLPRRAEEAWLPGLEGEHRVGSPLHGGAPEEEPQRARKAKATGAAASGGNSQHQYELRDRGSSSRPA